MSSKFNNILSNAANTLQRQANRQTPGKYAVFGGGKRKVTQNLPVFNETQKERATECCDNDPDMPIVTSTLEYSHTRG